MIITENFRILILFISVGLSIQGNSLLEVKLNIDPVIDPVVGLLSGRGKTTTDASPTTTVASTTTVAAHHCGKKHLPYTPLITNGLETKSGDWPWHVALYRLTTHNANQRYICGGTLLSENIVITAAHCVTENGAVIIPERLFAVMGKYNLAGGDISSQERGVFRIIRHPEFSTTTLAHDIAVLKLLSYVTYSEYVQPICLWNDDVSKSSIVNRLGTIVGWGFNENDTLSSELKMASVQVRDDLECIRSNAMFFSKYLTNFSFCAGFGNGTSACNGDSGGGMYFSSKNNGETTWYLRGIVSSAVSRIDKNINLCDSNFYTLFTDSAQYFDFINKYI